MNKLLSAASAIGMLLAVSAAQAADVITDERMDNITAGVDIDVSRSAIAAVVQNLRQSNRASIDVDQRADVDVGIGNATVTLTSNNTITQSNTGTQTNSGAVTAASVQ